MKKNRNKFMSLILACAFLVSSTILPTFAETVDTSPYVATTSTQTTTQTPKTPPISLFGISKAQIPALYTAKSGQYMVSPIYLNESGVDVFVQVFDALSKTGAKTRIEMDAYETASSIEGSFLAVVSDGQRIIVTLNQQNRISLNGNEAYTISAENYNALLAVYKGNTKNSYYAQWLIYMMQNQITKVTYQTTSGTTVTVREDALAEVISQVRATRVTQGKSYNPVRTDLVPSTASGLYKITLHFGEDVTYDLYYQGSTFYIQTSNMRMGIQYTLANGESARLLKVLTQAAGSTNTTSTTTTTNSLAKPQPVTPAA